jgi:hypothetical protein
MSFAWLKIIKFLSRTRVHTNSGADNKKKRASARLLFCFIRIRALTTKKPRVGAVAFRLFTLRHRPSAGVAFVLSVAVVINLGRGVDIPLYGLLCIVKNVVVHLFS